MLLVKSLFSPHVWSHFKYLIVIGKMVSISQH